MKKYFLYTVFILLFQAGFSQKNDVLSFSEYLGYVKKYHPIVKQSNLVISESEAKLLKARGSFDPKIEVDYDRKKFKNSTYYDKLNTAFKIPTWYGVELKGSYEQNSGEYLNPENTVPTDGLYNVGVSVSVARDLLINERMATLKRAKLFKNQAAADAKLLVNDILYKASMSYFSWLRAYQEKKVYDAFVENAGLRLEGVKRSFEVGEKPAIDTTEARIAYNTRKLNLEKAQLKYIKTSLELSNYLWINDVPVEIKNTLIPDTELKTTIDYALQIDTIGIDESLENHPKLQSLDYKYKSLEVDRRLKQNNLLPQVDLQYNFLSETPETINSFNTANYKAGVAVRFPLFLRKERADLKLTKFKLEAVDFDKQATSLAINNKLNSAQEEIRSYENQLTIADTIVSDYSVLLKGEERKFEIGESSLFLINSRESKLIESTLKVIALENDLLQAKATLFNVLGI
ncbi:TolC family protein [Marixanthomonas sp. SCSIO 43207]|uniref:TolC family protein n=1 Tax=Marixanthomonas sp. SCSIO 43207 TaxID=2779360 RepID=UPI001CA82166|nr:TolC family protein [Marixanthomonas sp. SCSIO 43207]UAB80629.1 TolC family protein [Marixanthomonas sp. SCSIO 43207]